MSQDEDLDRITALRQQLWRHGYRPVALKDGLKFSPEIGWTENARGNPPDAVALPARPGYRGTGILCDGLRVIEVDVAEPEMVDRIAAYAFDNLGVTLMRHRANSPRVLLRYRAA